MNSQPNHSSFTSDSGASPDALACLNIIGIDVADMSEAEALDFVYDRIGAGEHTKITFLNAHNANVAKTDSAFSNALASFTLLPDGIGVDIAAKWLHDRKFKANLNGTDFIPAILSEKRQPLKVGFFGAKPGVAKKAAAQFSTLDPAHDIRVLGHGYIDDDAQSDMLKELKIWQPDIVLVAMGVPRQELWIAEHLSEAHCTLAFGIGALFDFAAGSVPRAPKWVRQLRLEWLYRLANEPLRLAKRYLIGNPVFLLRVLTHKFSQKR